MELKHNPIVIGDTEKQKEQQNSYAIKLDEMKRYKEDCGTDYILDKAAELFKSAGNDPDKKGRAITTICKMMLVYPDYSTQDFYIEELSKIYKRKRIFTQELKALRDISLKANEDTTQTQPGPSANTETIQKYGFYIEDNKYFFHTQSGGYKEGTNFDMMPLFHIYSKSDNKRLIKITNEFGYERIIDVPSKILVSPDQFQQFLYSEGNFLIFITKNQFLKVLNHISNKFPLCHELKTLGWQQEGFYAFANGIYDPASGYQEADEYGITRFNNENYFSPAFSMVYKDVRQDDDEYENDRYFVYKQSKIDFNQWSTLMQKVYTKNGNIGVAFMIASLFRSFIYDRYKVFPHLFCFGEKGSGKTQMARSISDVFMCGAPPFNLNSGTDVAYYRRLGRNRDCVVFYDEFTNNLDEKRFQSLKSAYDGVGREKGKLTRDSRTEVDRVNAACCIAGQYLPTRDDNALYTRSIVINFEKKNYSEQDVIYYEKLKEHEKEGLSSIAVELLQFRPLFEKEFVHAFQEIFDRLRRRANTNKHYFEERILRNFVILMASCYIFDKKTPISLGYDYKTFEDKCYEMAIDQSEKISNSDALASFWNMVVFLLDTQQISAGYDFDIKEHAVVKVMNKEGKTTEVELNETYTPEKALFLRLDKIHPLYMKEFRSQHGEKGLELSSLKDYIKHHKAYLGLSQSHRFENINTSAFVFRYKDVGANLERIESGRYQNGENEQKNTTQNSEQKPHSNTPTVQQGSLNV